MEVEVFILKRCEVVLGEGMGEVNLLKYLGKVLYKHRRMEGEIRERERAVKGRIMRGRNVSIGVNKHLRNSILLPTLT